MQDPDTHLVEDVGYGKYFDRGPAAGVSQWRCSAVIKKNGGIGVVAEYGWRADDFGYPEVLVHETSGVREWRDEFWFQAEEAAVAFGVLVIDGVQGRNAFDHEALVEVSTYDAGSSLDDDVDDTKVVGHDGEVLGEGVPLREALVRAGILSEARLGQDPDGGSDEDSGADECSDGSRGGQLGEQDGSEDDSSDSGGSSDSGDSSGSGDSSDSDSDLDGDSDLEGNECPACGACWRIGERCRPGCDGEQ